MTLKKTMVLEKSGKMAEKLCTKCETIKPVAEFYRRQNSADGLHSWCKDCTKKVADHSKKQKDIDLAQAKKEITKLLEQVKSKDRLIAEYQKAIKIMQNIK